MNTCPRKVGIIPRVHVSTLMVKNPTGHVNLKQNRIQLSRRRHWHGLPIDLSKIQEEDKDVCVPGARPD